MRGVVEGYYGRPWGTEGRLSLMKFMGENGLNVFIYGPKDDPYHHARWREPYPAREMSDFARLLKEASKNGVSLYWAIHLGGGFRKGSEEDYAALFRKLGWMYDAGFRAFAVFFDDFGGADAAFHAEICNRVVTDFLEKRGGCRPLIMCPNVYWGSGHPYQRTLGERLDRRVEVMWTGRTICSDIRAEDVARITEDLRRPPFIWWNWPVNDYCRSSLLLGRAYGVEPCRVAGLVSNPMENCEASKIALYGVAKMCEDPEGFDSHRTWEESFSKIYPDSEVAGAMRVFAEHNSDQGPNGHGYRREESVSAAPLCARAREELAGGGLSDATSEELSKLFAGVLNAAKVLRRKLPQERYDLGWEIRGWIDDEEFLMIQGLCALQALKTGGWNAAAKKSVEGIVRARRSADECAESHRRKFASATFSADSGHVKSPRASSRELRPLVEALVEKSLDGLYQARFGRPLPPEGGLSAFSRAAELPGLQASLEGRYAGISRVMEARRVKPGESFGVTVPEGWEVDYFHARLGGPDAAKAGVIELSKSAPGDPRARWERLDTRNGGDSMESRLDPAAGWRSARYRNTSGSPVQIKIDLFKFDVRKSLSSVDRTASELLR